MSFLQSLEPLEALGPLTGESFIDQQLLHAMGGAPGSSPARFQQTPLQAFDSQTFNSYQDATSQLSPLPISSATLASSWLSPGFAIP